MSDVSHSQASCVFKEAWRKVKGMKRHFWASVMLFATIGLGGFCVLGIILIAGQVVYMPNLLQLFHGSSMFYTDPTFFVPAGMLVCVLVYHFAQALFEMFVLLPMRMGVRLIPLRRVADKPVHALFVFKYFTWKYIWRFIVLHVLIVLVVGIPTAVGVLLFCLPTTYHLGTALTVGSYIMGVLLYLFALYLLVSYVFVNCLVIDRDIHPWEAMGLSRNAVGKKWFCIFGTLIYLGILLLAATLLLLVGLIWVVPFTQNVIAILYRNMLGIEGKDPVSLKEAEIAASMKQEQ